MNHNHKKAINVIQYLNWLTVCLLIAHGIFGSYRTTNWYLALQYGIGIQVSLLLTNWVFGSIPNKRWFIYNCTIIFFIIIFKLLTQPEFGISQYFREFFIGDWGYALPYLFILIVNLLFLFSFFGIKSETKKIKKEDR